MISKKEVGVIAISIILFSLLLVFNNQKISYNEIPKSLILVSTIILISIFAKKITALKLDMEIEHKVWNFQRYWVTTGSKLPFPLPMGILFPTLLAIISGGWIKFLTFMQFESKALPSKVAKKYGSKRFSNVSEWDDALIGFYGILAIMILATLAKYLMSFDFFQFPELSKYALYFAAYNMIPFSKLDGNKIFFGSRPLYVFTLVLLAITTLIVIF
ncbi:MAG: hypothetical protein Q8L27_03360 [archaeon]|nr:hypothetical protein [archaeon]